MSDDGNDDATGGGSNPGDTAGDFVEGVGKLAEGIGDAAEGDALGAVGGVADGVGSLASGVGSMLPQDSEAGQAMRTAGAAVQTGSQLLNAGRGLAGAAQSGDVGRGLGAAGGATDAARYIVPDREAQQVLSGVGQAAGALQQGAQMLDQAGGALGAGQRGDVEFHLEVAGADGQWGLNTVTLAEALNTVSTCIVESMYSESVHPRDLIHQEFTITIERGDQQRSAPTS